MQGTANPPFLRSPGSARGATARRSARPGSAPAGEAVAAASRALPSEATAFGFAEVLFFGADDGGSVSTAERASCMQVVLIGE
eukprot:353830-Chlamydomonas_euryale.AAC.15